MANSDTDYARLRDIMVDEQIIARGVKDMRVIAAMRKVPRHLFVPEDERHRAYEDNALPIGHGQTISQPYMVAIMTELLLMEGTETVLEVGTGSGYQTAVLAELAKEVFSIERIPELERAAAERLRQWGSVNVQLRVSNGSLGWPERGPFDRIIVTAAAPTFPEPLLDQLADGGIGIAPIGSHFSQQLVQVMKRGDKTSERYHTPCVFVPLIGRYGWER
ncbi:MAG: protein-L-isoaspartate(D-aspartate) O-methyltransferase [Thermodesulfovibrionales bacterium]